MAQATPTRQQRGDGEEGEEEEEEQQHSAKHNTLKL